MPFHLNQQVTDTIDIVSIILKLGITRAKIKNKERSSLDSIFSSSAIPNISIYDYMIRWAEHLEFNDSHFVYMFTYIARYFRYNENDFINEHNIHRLILSALTLCHKYLDDNVFDHKTIALTGGIPIQELKQLEYIFFKSIEFDLYISEIDYVTTRKKLIAIAKALESKSNKKYNLTLSPDEEQILSPTPSLSNEKASSSPAKELKNRGRLLLPPLPAEVVARAQALADLYPKHLKAKLPFFAKIPISNNTCKQDGAVTKLGL